MIFLNLSIDYTSKQIKWKMYQYIIWLLMFIRQILSFNSIPKVPVTTSGRYVAYPLNGQASTNSKKLDNALLYNTVSELNIFC